MYMSESKAISKQELERKIEELEKKLEALSFKTKQLESKRKVDLDSLEKRINALLVS